MKRDHDTTTSEDLTAEPRAADGSVTPLRPVQDQHAAQQGDPVAAAQVELRRCQQQEVAAKEAAVAAAAHLETVQDGDRPTRVRLSKAQERLARAQRAVDVAAQARAAAAFRLEREHLAAHQATAQPSAAGDGDGDGDGEGRALLRFGSLPEFVEEFVLPAWRHRVKQGEAAHWCARWWAHAEAVLVLEAIWEAFEVMRLEPPPAQSVWIRDHLYPHMAQLTRPDGCFHLCGQTKDGTWHHKLPAQWATEVPPAQQFGRERSIGDEIREQQERATS